MGASTIASVSREVLELDPGGAIVRANRIAVVSTGASAATGGSTALARSQLVLSQVRLHVPVDHLVENGGRNVLQRLTKCCAHLILNLALEEVVEALTLANNS